MEWGEAYVNTKEVFTEPTGVMGKKRIWGFLILTSFASKINQIHPLYPSILILL